MSFFTSSSAAISVKDNNGTFLSTLSLVLYNVSHLCSSLKMHFKVWMCSDTKDIFCTTLCNLQN